MQLRGRVADCRMAAHSMVALAVLSTAALSGCRQDMHDQPKFFPQRSTSFYADGRSARPQIEGTVARDQLQNDPYFATGLIDGHEGDGLPIPLTEETMRRGEERYNIYCSPCHSRVGNGEGVIVQHGYRPAGDFHTERLRTAPLGHFFVVITNGYGAMPEYAAQVALQDRWAIAAYIRALQLSQHATPADVPSGQHALDLHEIAKTQGMPAGFAEKWSLPPTAVYGTPNGQDNGIPGQESGMSKGEAGTRTMPASGSQ